jgi:hypothetical protein
MRVGTALIVVLLLFLVGPQTVRANDVYYDCVVVEHLHLTEEGYRPYPAWSSKVGQSLIISKHSGEVRGPLPILDWERIRVVKRDPAYNVFMTRGYAFDGTPVNEVIVTGPFVASDVAKFVSIALLLSADILDGTCK